MENVLHKKPLTRRKQMYKVENWIVAEFHYVVDAARDNWRPIVATVVALVVLSTLVVL